MEQLWNNMMKPEGSENKMIEKARDARPNLKY
jgi:hypothetical protein